MRKEIADIIGCDPDEDEDPARITIESELWIWRPEPPAKAAWYFVTVKAPENKAAADALRARSFERKASGMARGFGSVPVRVAIGQTEWKTSVFPQSESGGYIMPVKAAVRKAEAIEPGDTVRLTLEY